MNNSFGSPVDPEVNNMNRGLFDLTGLKGMFKDISFFLKVH